jgi:carbonic anhydrase
MMTKLLLLACCFVMVLQGAERKTDLTPDQALAKLMEGNKRYLSSHSQRPHQSAGRRHELEKDQHPFACILSCSDSRVPPEIVFDEGLGDLFVVRVAGHIVDNAVTGSIEYAVEHLGSKLVLVLGHERCGAVQATLGGGEPGTHIQSLVEAISPAVVEAKKKSGEPLANAVRANVQLVVQQLRQSGPILAEQLRSHKIKIVGAVYELDSGSVLLLPE